MRPPSALVLAGLLLAGCGTPSRPPPPFFDIPPAPPTEGEAVSGHGMAGSPPRSSVVIPYPGVQTFLPGPSPDEIMRGPAPIQQPGRTAMPQYVPPPNVGPVTGYGPGGMAQPPGAPPNPPYPLGGLTHP